MRNGMPTGFAAAGGVLLNRFADRHRPVADRAVLHINDHECGTLAESSRAAEPRDRVGLALFQLHRPRVA
jgi:hypothetical protein